MPMLRLLTDAARRAGGDLHKRRERRLGDRGQFQARPRHVRFQEAQKRLVGVVLDVDRDTAKRQALGADAEPDEARLADKLRHPG